VAPRAADDDHDDHDKPGGMELGAHAGGARWLTGWLAGWPADDPKRTKPDDVQRLT